MEDNEVKKEEVERSGVEKEVIRPEDMDVKALRKALEKKETEFQELQNKYLRTLAEMDNFRKRAAREQTESIRYANEKIMSDLLPVIDNMERAITHSTEKKDFDVLIDGLNLILQEFSNAMDKHGVKCIESIGQPFDPSIHHAVVRVDTGTHNDNMIVEEFRKGYLLNDRVLRPALVSVAKKKDETKTES